MKRWLAQVQFPRRPTQLTKEGMERPRQYHRLEGHGRPPAVTACWTGRWHRQSSTKGSIRPPGYPGSPTTPMYQYTGRTCVRSPVGLVWMTR
ncbi:hypothetical protein NDU88_003791 [Pleurodeles waltl]|uniref:Uncharacterized protein n=1 Tax=Pleurodeles waltl TaxID=8319 RepID=A0AAV7PEU7_PLEWA|nr:hypothetical protein NDU88_003791 [Pleurodeles waltl]